MNSFVWDAPSPQYLTQSTHSDDNNLMSSGSSNSSAPGEYISSRVVPAAPPVTSFEETLALLSKSQRLEISPEQRAIYEFIYHGQGNGLINAVAGSGKTTTLLNTLWFVAPEKRVLILSFNKSVQMNLQQQIAALRPR
jgi:superfamily I DNA and RNA helicase